MSALRDRLEEYLDSVCEQIRWKRAREGTVQELRTHLLDQRDAYLELGMDEDTAVLESVRQMGDPVETGVLLDRIHRPKPQWGLLCLVGILLGMGYLAQILLRDVAVIDPTISDELFYETRWLFTAVQGIVIMFLLYFLDYTILARRPFLYYWAGIGGLTVLFLNSRKFGGRYFEIQFGMLLAPVLLALLIYSMRGKGWRGLFFCMCGTLLLAGMAILIPNITIALMIFGAGILMIVLSVVRGWMKVPVRRTLILIGAFLFLSAAFLCYHIICSGYVLRRLSMVFHPEQDPLGSGYHILVTRSLLSDARWIGQGDVTFPGFDSAEHILPDIPGSSLLTWIIHRLGWLAGLILLGTFALLLGWMMKKSLNYRGMFGCLISTAAVYTITVQVISFTLFNLGFPILGTLSLPLITYGRWAMSANMALIGLVLSVFREESLPMNQSVLSQSLQSGQSKKYFSISRFIFWENGNLIFAFGHLKELLLATLYPYEDEDEDEADGHKEKNSVTSSYTSD